MQVAEGSKDVCLEDTVGDLFRKMVFTDALVYTIVTLISFAMVKTVRKGKKIECAERPLHHCITERSPHGLMRTHALMSENVFIVLIRYDSIRAAQEAINVMYRQVITWVSLHSANSVPRQTAAFTGYRLCRWPLSLRR
jgi:hypothetical protein